MFHAKDVESPNLCVIVEVSLDEISLTSGVNSPMPRSHTMEVNPFHVIFNLNGILIAARFDKGSCTILLHPILKEFFKKFLVQFQVYISVQPNITISIIIWIKFGAKQKSLYILPKCLIRSVTYKIHISYQINLASQFSTRSLMFSFLCFLTLTLATHCS